MTPRQLGALGKGSHAIAAEMADYAKKSFEESTALAERCSARRSSRKAIELQSAYIRNSYESFVAQATTISELYADLAKEALQRPLSQASTK